MTPTNLSEWIITILVIIAFIWRTIVFLTRDTCFWLENFSSIHIKDIKSILEAYRFKSGAIDYPVVLHSNKSPLSIEINQLSKKDRFVDRDRDCYKVSIFTTTYSGEKVELQHFKTNLLISQTDPNPFLEIKGPWRREVLNIMKLNKKEAESILRKTKNKLLYEEELKMKEKKEVYLKTVKGE